MIYYTKPHTVEAFRFEPQKFEPPAWFTEACFNARASVTISPKHNYVTIYTKRGNVERAYEGDWICMNAVGKIFSITNDEFRLAYVTQ